MNPSRVSMSNFYAPSRGYFERAILPHLTKTQSLAAPAIFKFVIAGKHIHFHIYGEAGARMFPIAFEHQEPSYVETPDLIIHAWDSTLVGTDPIAPWDDPDYMKATEPDAEFFGAYVMGEESLSFYDKKTDTGYFWMQDASNFCDWGSGAPLRAILHWFLNANDIHLIHGAVIGHDTKGILITAKSGSGKSTTALASIIAGMDYVSDDYAAMEHTGDSVTAHSLYQSGKVTRTGLEFFPELKPIVWNKHFSGAQKAVVFMRDLFPDQVKTSLPLRAVLIPRITGGETRIIPANRVEALVAIAPTTMMQLPMAETRKLSILKSIIEKVPCYYLDLGPDVRGVPDVIKSFLQQDTI